MKLYQIPLKSTIQKSIPFNYRKEITGYVEGKHLYFKDGARLTCPTFPDKKTVFHTHIDALPTARAIVLPDMPSPMDILVFLVNDNIKMFIKTTRVIITLQKSAYTKKLANKVLRCILENEKYWKAMVRESNNSKMFFYLLHYLHRDIPPRNRVWNLSWKRILERILKIKVNIETSDIKDPL